MKDFSKNRSGGAKSLLLPERLQLNWKCERRRNKKITQVSSAGSGGCIEEREIALFDASWGSHVAVIDRIQAPKFGGSAAVGDDYGLNIDRP